MSMSGNIMEFTPDELRALAEEEKEKKRLLQQDARKNQEPSVNYLTWMDIEFSKN